MRHVAVAPGVRLAFEDVGAGRPVVLLHGYTMSHRVWATTVAHLAGRHRVVLPDLRGHGDSDKPVADLGPERHAADVAALLDALDLRDATVVGWSFGGMVAMRLAAAHPERLAQVVLVNAAGPKYLATPDFPDGHTEDDLAGWLRREREDLAAWRHFLMASMPAQPYDARFTDWLWAESLRAPTWSMAPMLEAFTRADLRPALPSVAVPALIVHGQEDAWCLPAAARYVAAHVKDAELVELPGCGHSPQWEERDRFEALLDGFVRRVPPDRLVT